MLEQKRRKGNRKVKAKRSKNQVAKVPVRTVMKRVVVAVRRRRSRSRK